MTIALRILVIERWTDRIQFEHNDTLVAVTSEALQDLRDRRIPHITPEQYGFTLSLADAERRLWPAQLDWLEEIGNVIAAGTPVQQEVEARHFPWAYGWAIKGLVDRLIVANEECDALLRACPQPTAVHLYEDPKLDESEAEVFNGWPEGARARRVVWRERARAVAVPLFIHAGDVVRTESRPSRKLVQVGRHLARVLRRAARPARIRERNSGRVVLLHDGPDLSPLAVDLLAAGHVCLFVQQSDRGTIELRAFPENSVLFAQRLRPAEWTLPADIRTIAEKAGRFAPPAVIEPLRRGLEAWLSYHAPRYLSLAAAVRDLMRQANVRAVVTGYIGSDLAAAFVGAAAATNEVQSALVAHGDSPEVAPAWDLHELLPYKHYFVPNREFADYFRQRKGLLGRTAAEVHEGSNRWHEYEGWREPPSVWLNRWDYAPPLPRRHSPLLGLGRKPVVVYVSSGLPWQLRYLSKPDYTENFTHDLQVAICAALAAHTSISAVLKLYPWHRSHSAIERYLRTSRSRVKVSRAPMRYWFPRADAIIVDHPSTSLYQAAVAGVPSLILLSSDFEFRDTALAELPGKLVRFGTPAEAGERVTDFLRNFPPPMPTRLKFEKANLAHRLLELAGIDGI